MTAPKSTTKRTLLVGLVGIAVIGAIVSLAIMAPSGLPGMPKTTVKATFGDVGILQVGNDVRENSERIGEVSDVSYEKGRAVVTLELDGEVDVYRDARASIWDQSALAKKFVELDRGHPEAGPLGDQIIAGTRKDSADDLDKLLDVFDAKTRAAATGTLREVGGGLAGHGRDLNAVVKHAPSLLDDAGRLSRTLASQRTNLPELLHAAEELSTSFAGREQQLATLVSQSENTIEALHADGALEMAVYEAPVTLRQLRSTFDALDQPLSDTQQAFATLRPGLKSLGGSAADLRGFLREAVVPLNRVPGVADSANPALSVLTQTVADARPLAPRLSSGFIDAATPLQVLSPYTADIGRFFERISSMVSTSAAPGVHAARVGVALQGATQGGGGFIKDPLTPRNPYPAPGEADSDRAATPLDTGGR